MNFRYAPFKHPIGKIEGANLACLYEVSEGWYVEYKSQAITVRALAKSLSAFANQYGGWLFIGIAEDKVKKTAGTFPGILELEVEKLLQHLSDASRDMLSPEVYFETQVVDGPVDEVGLGKDHSIVIVRVPPGADTPYIHSDGRIYRRVADSSAPKEETDRTTLDLLWNRGDRAKKKLKQFVTRLPAMSKGEDKNCFMYLTIMSDPYEIGGDWYSGKFDDFTEVMQSSGIPFDNFYTKVGGYVARQVIDNNPRHRNFTWEFDKRCHSFVSLPMNQLIPPYSASLHIYDSGIQFAELLDTSGLDTARVLDLNLLLEAIAMIIKRHRILVATSGITGPFYVKANLNNIWRTTPYLDAPTYIEHVKKYGLPVVQDNEALVPQGFELETFIKIPERISKEHDVVDVHDVTDTYIDAMTVSIPIFNSLGIPFDLLQQMLKELFKLSGKFKAHQQIRNDINI